MQTSTTLNNRTVRAVAWLAIISMPLAYANEVVGLLAIDFNIQMLAEPARAVTLGREAASLFQWNWPLAMFGYYLLIAPLALLLYVRLRPGRDLAMLIFSAAGLFYLALGAAGTAVLWAVWPKLQAAYAVSSGAEQIAIATTFGALANGVAVGLWGVAGRFAAAAWWLGIGSALRTERPRLGWLTLLLGGLSLIAVLGNLVAVGPLVGLGTQGVLLLSPLWALWLGLDLLRNPQATEAGV
ncbi:MAG: hypothetical protein R3191_03640 [Anaerolineales bacterium]|nr:hypothetical protein [Anaerolineales bacterium]